VVLARMLKIVKPRLKFFFLHMNCVKNNDGDVDDDEEDAEERGREEREEPFPSPPLASTQADFTDQWVSQAAQATESGS
jgi:hypothetical protein